jgi:hypothetical protein
VFFVINLDAKKDYSIQAEKSRTVTEVSNIPHLHEKNAYTTQAVF